MLDGTACVGAEEARAVGQALDLVRDGGVVVVAETWWVMDIGSVVSASSTSLGSPHSASEVPTRRRDSTGEGSPRLRVSGEIRPTG